MRLHAKRLRLRAISAVSHPSPPHLLMPMNSTSPLHLDHVYELQVVKVMLEYVGICDIYNAIPDLETRVSFAVALQNTLNDQPNMFFVDERLNAAVRNSSSSRHGTSSLSLQKGAIIRGALYTVFLKYKPGVRAYLAQQGIHQGFEELAVLLDGQLNKLVATADIKFSGTPRVYQALVRLALSWIPPQS